MPSFPWLWNGITSRSRTDFLHYIKRSAGYIYVNNYYHTPYVGQDLWGSAIAIYIQNLLMIHTLQLPLRFQSLADIMNRPPPLPRPYRARIKSNVIKPAYHPFPTHPTYKMGKGWVDGITQCTTPHHLIAVARLLRPSVKTPLEIRSRMSCHAMQFPFLRSYVQFAPSFAFLCCLQ